MFKRAGIDFARGGENKLLEVALLQETRSASTVSLTFI